MRAITFSVLALTLIAACGDTDRPLRDLQAAGGGPDEFAVIPQERLEIPAVGSLPRPTPGGTNRADPTPNADAIAALGGSAAAQAAGGIPANDAGLVARVSRYGVDPAIRAELAAADEARLDRARATNVFNPLGRDRYFPAYAREALDASAERARLTALGVAVPTPSVAQQPTAPAQSQPEPEMETATEVTEPRLLQRTVDRLLGQGSDDNVESSNAGQNCVIRTVPPDNLLQRICEPVEPEGQ